MIMKPEELELVRGDSIDLRIQFPTGTDITGHLFWFTVKPFPAVSSDINDSTAIFSYKTTASGPDAALGIVDINIPYTKTDKLISGAVVTWSLQWVNTSTIPVKVKTIVKPVRTKVFDDGTKSIGYNE